MKILFPVWKANSDYISEQVVTYEINEKLKILPGTEFSSRCIRHSYLYLYIFETHNIEIRPPDLTLNVRLA